MDDDEQLIMSMLRPTTWSDASFHGFSQPPVPFLSEIPRAIYKKGILIDDLCIELSMPMRFSALPRTESDLEDLKNAAQGLKKIVFRVLSEYPPIVSLPEHDIKLLIGFTTALLKTERLKKIYLEFPSQLMATSSLSSVIAVRSWPCLTEMELSSVPLHLEELDQFVRNNCTSDAFSLPIHNMHFLSGNWAEGLDVLRRIHLKKILQFNDPSGGELSQEEIEVVFNRGGHYRSKAEWYIERSSDTNPLRDREEVLGDMLDQ